MIVLFTNMLNQERFYHQEAVFIKCYSSFPVYSEISASEPDLIRSVYVKGTLGTDL